jgi:1,4-dihydroxy-2-naphthoate polyprenyltransferase
MKNNSLLGWLKIIRLQFYPMTYVAYSLGAVALYSTSHVFNWTTYWIGYAILFMIEVCSVLTNEYFDYDTDKANLNAGPFTGGSRVLVDGLLRRNQVRSAGFFVLALIAGMGFALIRFSPSALRPVVLVLLAVGVVLGLGYTAPPLKLCYRGAGEIVVGLTHAPYMIICGYTFQSGAWNDSLPWLLSLPLFCAVLSAITLAGIPDAVADRAVGKITFAVAFGPRVAIGISVAAGCLAAVSALMLCAGGLLVGLLACVAVCAVFLHWVVLASVLLRLARANDYNKRIDGILALALGYIIWFGVIPLANVFFR